MKLNWIYFVSLDLISQGKGWEGLVELDWRYAAVCRARFMHMYSFGNLLAFHETHICIHGCSDWWSLNKCRDVRKWQRWKKTQMVTWGEETQLFPGGREHLQSRLRVLFKVSHPCAHQNSQCHDHLHTSCWKKGGRANIKLILTF